jgi:hypothetical protein
MPSRPNLPSPCRDTIRYSERLCGICKRYTVARFLSQKLAWVRHGHAASLSFGHNLNDTVALYGRVQIELVILSKIRHVHG